MAVRGTTSGGSERHGTRTGVPALPTVTYTLYKHPQANDQCDICLDHLTNPFTLPKCKHVFCTTCVDYKFEYNPECPTCGESYGERGGEQPSNGVVMARFESMSLSGYEQSGTIEITYVFPPGIQAVSESCWGGLPE